MEEGREEGYLVGYRDAQEGLPPQPPNGRNGHGSEKRRRRRDCRLAWSRYGAPAEGRRHLTVRTGATRPSTERFRVHFHSPCRVLEG